LKESIEKILLTDVIEEFPTYITIYGEDCTILWANRISRERNGLALEDLGKIKCYEHQGRTEPCEDCIVSQAFKTGHPHEAESLEFESRDSLINQNSWYQKATPLRDRNGNTIGVFKISHNLSEHIQRRLESGKDIEFIHDLVEKTDDIIWTSNSNGVLDYVNPAMERVLGYTREDLAAKPAIEFTHPEDRARFEEMLPGLIRERKGWKNFLIRWKHKDGSWHFMESSSSPVLDSKGRVIAFRGVDRDVTEKEQLVAQLLQAQKMESIGRFAGGMSHDFNNMLGVIMGYLELAFKKLEPAHPVYDYLEQINEAAQRSANLTRQLLAFARKQQVDPKVLDLNSVVETMLKMIQRLIGTDIRLVWIPDKDLWPIEIDPGQVDQILANLCVNARDAIDGVGTITIRTENRAMDQAQAARFMGLVPGEYVVLSVEDTGCGIEKEFLNKIFEPFFTTKPKGEGTGLGLSTIYGIVKQSDGYVYASSEVGRGSRFDIYLPPYSGERQISGLAPRARETRARGESILLVDDEKSYLRITKLLLENLGYKVTATTRPARALEIFRRNPARFDLLITDKIMPEMRGMQLRDEIRAIRPDIKHFFISGHSIGAEPGGSRIEIDAPFLQKPFTQRELSNKIREVLDEE